MRVFQKRFEEEVKRAGEEFEQEETKKDASTNTILSGVHFQAPFSQVEEKIESVLLRQKTIFDSFEFFFREMKVELTAKSESLVSLSLEILAT